MSLAEFDWIRTVADASRPNSAVEVGIGDDAAVLAEIRSRISVACDTIVAGTHFRWDWSTPEQVAYKAVAANVSDLAAMAARPLASLAALSVGTDLSERALARLGPALAEAANEFGLPLVGGDTTRIDGPTVLTVTVLGAHDHEPVLRSGARAGDAVVVSGTIGDSGAGLRLLLSGENVPTEYEPLVRRHRRPEPRLSLGQAMPTFGATAALDVSDGLVADVGHIAAASRVRIELQASQVPLSRAFVAWAAGGSGGPSNPAIFAATQGEDFELVVCLPEERVEHAMVVARKLGVPLTRVGRVTDASDEPEVVLLDREGSPIELSRAGWQHF